MQNRLRQVLTIAALSILFSGCSTASNAAYDNDGLSDAKTVWYLVRHAEKAHGGTDPSLTNAGQRRAEALAQRLLSAGVQAIYSTNYRRTLNTAAPLAERLGLPILSYDPRELKPFAEQLQRTPVVALIVGHSNTTPTLVTLLGGAAGEPISEADEFDRLYILQVTQDGGVSSEMVRYGD